MRYTVYDRLLKREVGQQRRNYTDIRGIYGDRQWVEKMDIVNELAGHNGCVNALSWSKSGRLLASGSDDERILIHAYCPESSTSQFRLTTQIMTSHRTNIFSVKFMPYSNDRTIVSATDTIKVFDITRSGHDAYDIGPRSRNRSGVQLSEGDTNAKTFRCHNDTVKRIVTEDSPFYFLTCSNDGDVRQWDIRQPASAYPPSTDRMAPHWARDPDASDDCPAPLISYSRYNLDLNTVSCSPSQPHYIALGGAHLHCFLHDRRMLGRDKYAERGLRLSSPSQWNETDNEVLGQATQCVKKFAPNGTRRMKRHDTGHITACKISDANPNELIVSWSQEHIYGFDMLRAPDAREEIQLQDAPHGESSRVVKDRKRKRKRPKSTTLSQDGEARAESRPRTQSTDEDLALRVTYNNGQSEDIRIQPSEPRLSQSELDELKATDHYRIAKTTMEIKTMMFDLGEHGETGLKLSFTSILGRAHSILGDIDDIARTWGYPVNPDAVDLAVQHNLRQGRSSIRRYVQASGVLARLLGGQLLTGANSDAHIAQNFARIQHAPREQELTQHEQFGYDFLKAICLWLDSGPGAVVEGFSSRSSGHRLPIPADSDIDAIQDHLIPYLLNLASDEPVINVDVSKFEKDATRQLFPSEKAAVITFSRTIQRPFHDLTGADSSQEEAPARKTGQSREAAKRKWAYGVGRGILRNAGKDISFAAVDRAFGGRGISESKIKAEEKRLKEKETEVDPSQEDPTIVDAEIISGAEASSSSNTRATASQQSTATDEVMEEVVGEDDDDDDDETDGEGGSGHEDEEDSEDESEDEDGLRRTRSGRMFWRSDFGRSRFRRDKVELDVPCVPHTRVYTGHCNVKTVKDVNFFGLHDEYVVSGSDDGNVFIWDRKTSQLVNILEGDGEVVNVVQGHPYEPTMAVSGIDHTIKVFSPDTRLQRNARKGIGVQSANPSGFSSLNWGRRRHAQVPRDEDEDDDEDSAASSDTDSDGEDEGGAGGLRSRKRMHKSYEITSKNDMERKGGREDYFISSAVFAHLARHFAAAQQEGADEDGAQPIVISDDNCATM